MNLELHVFTNSIISAPDTTIISKTYQSFQDIFGKNITPTVWCDPNPNIAQAHQYILNLKEIFPTVRLSQSLSDGYIKAINKSRAEYLFMLEHDWEFLPSITHTLEEILTYMEKYDLWHLRFNKRKTAVEKTDKWLLEQGEENFKFCLTPSVSNNPHILHKQKYQEKALPLIKKSNGSKGIEHNLLNIEGMSAAIYGGIEYPMTIRHLDGKRKHV